jgi:pyrroline-5-carboxylate reductase
MADTGTDETKLLLVGGGRMGSALVHGWLDRGFAASAITVVEPTPAADIEALRHDGATLISDSSDVSEDYAPDVVVLAIKPQMFGTVLDGYARFATFKPVFLSIAAGITIARLAETLGKRSAIVRAMPNTPAAVGSGMSVLIANRRATRAQHEQCQNLMAAVGETAWIDDENLMDAVTGVSGSGPAYVFLLVEALREAGIAAGLPEALAVQLARATVIGSSDLLRQARETASELREAVTSPGGTTAAALEILMAEDGLEALMSKAVRRAAERSRELAGA